MGVCGKRRQHELSPHRSRGCPSGEETRRGGWKGEQGFPRLRGQRACWPPSPPELPFTRGGGGRGGGVAGVPSGFVGAAEGLLCLQGDKAGPILVKNPGQGCPLVAGSKAPQWFEQQRCGKRGRERQTGKGGGNKGGGEDTIVKGSRRRGGICEVPLCSGGPHTLAPIWEHRGLGPPHPWGKS